jgi:hypothetical protein
VFLKLGFIQKSALDFERLLLEQIVILGIEKEAVHPVAQHQSGCPGLLPRDLKYQLFNKL